MGRTVSCERCGAWGEIPPDQSPQNWLCPACREQAAAPEPQPGRGAKPSRAVPGPGAALGGGEQVAIGRDSGTIGSAGFGSAAADLDAQIREMHEAAQQLTVGTADIGEVSERLSRPPVPTARPRRGRGAEQEGAESLAAFAAAKAAEEGRRLAEEAADFGRQQAGKVVDRAEQLAREKGIGAAREIGDFAQSEARRIGTEARDLADRKARTAAAKAADVAREKLDQARGKSRRVVTRTLRREAPARCAICNGVIAPGDRTVVCPDCKAAYHAECYELAGACVSDACRRKRRSSATQAAPYAIVSEPTSAPKPRPDRSRRCLACGARVSDKALVCPHCGRWLHSRSTSTSRPGPGPSRQSQIGPGCIVSVVIAAFLLFALISRM